MNTEKDFGLIKRQTRLALPSDDGYIFRLGVALYGFASLSSFMAEIACHLDRDLKRQEIESGTGGEILNAFRKTVKAAKKKNPRIGEIGQVAANIFEALNTQRSDFVHSYPITNKVGAQILHRRNDSKGKYFEVTNDFLDGFIARLHDVSSALYDIRSIVKKI